MTKFEAKIISTVKEWVALREKLKAPKDMGDMMKTMSEMHTLEERLSKMVAEHDRRTV